MMDSQSLAIQPGPTPKRAHKKSRTGCTNCKARKIKVGISIKDAKMTFTFLVAECVHELKCDETRPLCNNCAKHYANLQSCEWSTTAQPRTSGVPHRPARPTWRSPLPEVEAGGSFRHYQRASQQNISANISDLGVHLLDPFSTHPESSIQGIDTLLRNCKSMLHAL